MLALHGVGVLVTRPAHQAEALCRLLEAHGATAVRWPALRITGTPRPPGAEWPGPPGSFDLIVFTSVNAVRFGGRLLHGTGTPALAAIGPATATALREAGYPVAVTPKNGFDSEHLLREPTFKNGAGRRVLIVTGTLGRHLLQDRLAARGAEIVTAEVYERARVHRDPEQLAALAADLAAGTVEVITATSVDIALCLLELATPTLRREFDRVQWLVPSARVAAALRERGLLAPLLLASSAQDHDLVAAIVGWRSYGSRA